MYPVKQCNFSEDSKRPENTLLAFLSDYAKNSCLDLPCTIVAASR